MPDLTLADRTLGVLLGLGDLQLPEPCLGYQNCCICPECRERVRAVREQTDRILDVRQPWEPRQAA